MGPFLRKDAWAIVKRMGAYAFFSSLSSDGDDHEDADCAHCGHTIDHHRDSLACLVGHGLDGAHKRCACEHFIPPK